MQSATYYIEGLWRQPSAAAARTYLGINSTNLTTVADVNVTFTDNVTGNASVLEHGFLPKLSGNPAEFFNGNGAWALVKDSDLSLSDILTNNVTIARHGFAPKLPNDATKYLDGTGAYSVPAGSASGINQLTGDVTAGPGSGAQAATIANDAVTYAKMQNVSAASKLLGRGSAAGAGDVEEITLGTNLSMSGTTLNATGGGGSGTVTNTGTLTDHGVIVGNGGVDVSALAAGTNNTVLHGVTGADPAFSAVVEADITLTDNATNDVSITKHGFAPKAPNDATKFLDGTGSYTVPSGSAVDYFRQYLEYSLIPAGATTCDPTNCGRTESTATSTDADGTNPQILNYATTASANNDVSVGTTNANCTHYGHDSDYEAYVLAVDTTSNRIWAGLTNNTVATQAAGDTPAGQYAMFRASTAAGDTNWKAVTNNAGSNDIVDTGVAISTVTLKKFGIRWDGATTGKVKYYINDVLVATSTIDLSATALMGMRVQVRTLVNTAKNVKCAGQKMRVKYF